MTELFATCHFFIFNCKLSKAALFVNTSVERMSYFSGHHLTLAYKYTLVNSDRGSGLRARSVANTDMFRTRHRPRSASGTQCQRTLHSAFKHIPMQSPLLSFLWAHELLILFFKAHVRMIKYVLAQRCWESFKPYWKYLLCMVTEILAFIYWVLSSRFV